MVFSQIMLGVLLILLIFSVGESVITASKMSMAFVTVSIITILVSSFFKPIYLFNSYFYLSGFFIPLLISVYFCFRLNSLYSLLRIVVCALLVSILLLVYNSINLEVISYNLLQPYILLGIVIGISSFYICKTFFASFIGVFLGTVITPLIFYSIQNISIGGIGFTFGNEQMLTILLVSSVFSLFSLYISRKIRYLRKKRARKISIENKRSA